MLLIIVMSPKIKYLVPVIYLIGAIFVWRDFASLPPDGLANLGILLYTLPIVLVALLVTTREFPYLGGDGGYYHTHAIYFAISVIILAIGCFLFLFGIETWWKRNQAKRQANPANVA